MDAIIRVNVNGEFGDAYYLEVINSKYRLFNGCFVNNDNIYISSYIGGLGGCTSFSYKGDKQ